MTANMAGKLPDGDTNGLGRILSRLIHNPDEVHVGIVLFDTSKLTHNVDTGDVTPTVRIRAIEPALPGADTVEAQRLLRRAHSERTGDLQLPLDLEQAIDSWLSKVDPTTEGDQPTLPEPDGVLEAVIHDEDCPGADCECGVDTTTGEVKPKTPAQYVEEAHQRMRDEGEDPETPVYAADVVDVVVPDDASELGELPTGPEWGDPADDDQGGQS